MSDVVYGWTGGAENSGLPFPIADQSSPNAARDIQKLAEHLPLDVDAAGVTNFGTTGPPMALFGTSRPDGLDGSTLIQAPTGSTYTFSGSDDELTAVYGAQAWRKAHYGWTCVEGMAVIKGDQLPANNSQEGGWVTTGSANRSALTIRRYPDVSRISYAGGHNDKSIVSGDNIHHSDAWWGQMYRQIGTGRRADAAGFNTHNGNVVNGAWDLTLQFTGNPSVAGGTVYFAFDSVIANTIPWPSTGITTSMQIGELRELIEAAEDPDHPQHEQLQQLKSELAELTGTKPGENEE